MEGKKSLFGYYVLYGSESRGGWLQILNDMIHRGMQRVMILVSGDFPGLQQAVKSLLPGTDHQLCFVHLQKNVRGNMSKSDAKIFNQELTRIRLENDYENALIRLEELCKHFRSKYPAYIEVAMFVTIDRISKNKWKKPMMAIKEIIYEFRQMFNSKFPQQIQYS